MAEKASHKVLVVKSKDWLKAQRSADEKPLVDELSQSPAVNFVYVYKDQKHPDKWGVAAVINLADDRVKDILDKVARQLGYVEGILSRKFMEKHIKDNCLRKMARP